MIIFLLDRAESEGDGKQCFVDRVKFDGVQSISGDFSEHTDIDFGKLLTINLMMLTF